MQARDLMTRSVVTVQPRTPLAQAISLLVGNGFAALPVVDEDGHVIGMLSESNR
ncbi:HPP family protein [Antrihabitans sp. YC2-6]|uniref:CBS domain-containing protein n=1 Tax=Antrihabitans sp. YC2-6 TaxID=2799498 RepID=UPI0018F6218A|nr:CBS domain-containing protein [Antrihabitans sp. YC2-6]MBJ8346985.1 CBS domain-containing protein [Antrihabitans sp. YC2-6]